MPTKADRLKLFTLFDAVKLFLKPVTDFCVFFSVSANNVDLL